MAADLTEADIHADLAPRAGPVTVAPWGFSQVNLNTFSRIRLAIERSTRLKLEFRSVRTPEPHPRTVEPHSLVQAGRRWHMRGCCLGTADFRNFVLERVTKISMLDHKAETSTSEEVEWTTLVKVRIQAHPKLTPGQQDLVRSEYFDGTAARVRSCRDALLPYLIQESRLALDVSKELPPGYQMAVENFEEVHTWLFPG